jgi:hypothetical protein
MKIKTFDEMLTEKTHFNQKKRKERISIYRKKMKKLKEVNKQKSKIAKIITE